jgi:hypothetical protein
MADAAGDNGQPPKARKMKDDGCRKQDDPRGRGNQLGKQASRHDSQEAAPTGAVQEHP